MSDTFALTAKLGLSLIYSTVAPKQLHRSKYSSSLNEFFHKALVLLLGYTTHPGAELVLQLGMAMVPRHSLEKQHKAWGKTGQQP